MVNWTGALGFAFRDIAENYIAGVLLSLRRPFAPGEHVVIDNREGKVVALTSRATILMTLDGNELRLPNAMVFKAVVLNYSKNPQRRFDFTITIDADRRLLHLDVPDDELARRRAQWRPREPRYTRGVLGKYQKLVQSASKGAVLS